VCSVNNTKTYYWRDTAKEFEVTEGDIYFYHSVGWNTGKVSAISIKIIRPIHQHN